MKSLLCILGIHNWGFLLPLSKVEFDGKEWLALGGINSRVCTRCGELSPGTCLLPYGREGGYYIIGEGYASKDNMEID